jgi:DNA adenine methylase
MKSIIRWAGSKRSLLPELRTRVPEDVGTYIEPFAGSACLFFDVRPRRAILSDLNLELINTYRAVRRNPEIVVQCFRRLRRGKNAYYRIRAIDPMQLSDAEQAARFLYLNRFCFNGLFRTNLKGKFNVPYGPPTKPLRVFESDVLEASEILRVAELTAEDFETTIDSVEKGDFVYLDPPYVLNERRVFHQYLPGSFMRSDLARLSTALEKIDTRGATFLLSYAESAEAKKLVAQWHHKLVWARRNIAGFVGARKGAVEILASNRPL